METQAGIPLTEEEIKLVKSLQRVADKWAKHGKRLWLFSGAATLHVMMHGDIESNPNPEMTNRGVVNQDNIVSDIKITNDGGDW